MATNERTLYFCNILHDGTYYDVAVAVSDLDEMDQILQDWALDVIGEALTLPDDLVYAKTMSEIVTSLDTGNVVYLESAESSYMEMPRYAGMSGTLPTFPTALDDDSLYLMPEGTAFLYSEASYGGYFGEYTIAEKQLALTEGMNYIGVRFNSGSPEYIKYDDDTTFDYSSIIPVIAVLLYTSTLYVIPYGQTGYGLPEKLFKQKYIEPQIVGAFTLTASTNYVNISALTVLKGTQETACLVVDTSAVGNTMYLYYKDASDDWQKSATTTINNTQYQGTGLQTLGSGKFVVNYIYRFIHGTTKMVFILLSGSFDTLAEAQASEYVSDIPDVIEDSAVLVGRMIVEKSSTSPTVQKVQKYWFGNI